MPKKIAKREFPFVSAATLEARLNIRNNQRMALTRRLATPTYWWRFPGGRKTFWNWVLIEDLMLFGDGPRHQELLREYLATLPQSRE